MKRLSVMLKPASSLCNLRCKYCFYANITSLREVSSFGIMKEETAEKILENIFADLEKGDELTLAFQGGEPTIAGLNFFKNFVKIVNQKKDGVRVRYALQTNGTLLDEEWCKFLSEYHFLTGISLDLSREQHDSIRVDAKGNGTYRDVVHTVRLLKKHNVEFNILCTLTNMLARHPQKVWNCIQSLDLQYVQFTPCLDELDKPGESVYALTPQRFASFYTRLFDLWYEDLQKGKYRSIKLFDDIIWLLADNSVTACGMGGYCQPQLIVEADGSVYPCDFFCLDEYCLGNFLNENIRTLYEKSARFVAGNHGKKLPLCKSCSYEKICGGGCRRMRREVCCTEESKFCGYQKFLNETYPRLQKIAAMQR